jgi:hypothetical protein
MSWVWAWRGWGPELGAPFKNQRFKVSKIQKLNNSKFQQLENA